jgi:hypothetical protein
LLRSEGNDSALEEPEIISDEFGRSETLAICVPTSKNEAGPAVLTIKYFADKGEFDGPSVRHEPIITGRPVKPRKWTEGQERVIAVDMLRGSLVHTGGRERPNPKVMQIRLFASLEIGGGNYDNRVEVVTESDTIKFSKCRFGIAYNVINGWKTGM